MRQTPHWEWHGSYCVPVQHTWCSSMHRQMWSLTPRNLFTWNAPQWFLKKSRMGGTENEEQEEMGCRAMGGKTSRKQCVWEGRGQVEGGRFWLSALEVFNCLHWTPPQLFPITLHVTRILRPSKDTIVWKYSRHCILTAVGGSDFYSET